MAKQSIGSWLLWILGAFNRAGAAALAAGPVGVVMLGGTDIWSRVVIFVQFAVATWVLAGIHGLAEYVSSDPVPLDDDGK